MNRKKTSASAGSLRRLGLLSRVPVLVAVGVALGGCPADDTGAQDPATATDTEAADSSSGGLAFEFASDDPSAYTRVDRLGMPGVATALIASKEQYNAADPADDAAFVDEITATVEFLHDALDDDVTGFGLTPCAPADCVAAAGPFVVPDVIAIDATADAGFPNGRRLADPVMDVVLALLMLDLGTHTPTTLAEVPLNPPENDVPFATGFPYLAPPHAF